MLGLIVDKSLLFIHSSLSINYSMRQIGFARLTSAQGEFARKISLAIEGLVCESPLHGEMARLLLGLIADDYLYPLDILGVGSESYV